MVDQLSLLIPEIDRDATQENVEKAIAKYRYYALQTEDEFLPKITASYSMVPPTNTNAFHSSTEDTAVRMVDFERERMEYITRFAKAVNRLSKREREAFILKYMNDEELYDYEVYNQLGMGETYYYTKFKPRMFYKFAIAMRIEVYKTEKE
ncbi:ArpU family phage packaging/lysis transcriptional regulator [Heyndrickxia coagulans]|uniref:ArpU family phage packaging/lysis transcriptional regulator n=1 Tax=Heyndrickxia coagulans TaxID=1398 RepID=UPI002E01FC46|nr:ArpU family phage packaging/lysis transcriptional regulator [Heyndrickxia coagulans]MEC5268259.1 ArpU family phage packaging/lysis transcriptional regulator [Heyndrickxia coagulans]